jgi:LacI family transcriptional regulator
LERRITQRDIAREAHVSHVTVSLALRESPTIPKETRDRIHAIAERLGYSPDPMLAALSSYKKQQRPAAHQATIAWLFGSPSASKKGEGDFLNYYLGAEARADQLGYVLEEIDINGELGEPKRLRRMLDARNITGIILAPSHLHPNHGHAFEFELSRFSAVRIGYSYRAPVLNTVANAQFRTVLTAMQKVVALGYQRIGTILTKQLDERTSWQFLGAYLAGVHFLPRKGWIDPFYTSNTGPGPELEKPFFEWLERQKIDCVVAAGYGWLCREMIQRGIKVPQAVGYVDTQLPEADHYFSGIHQNPRQVGRGAVDLLVGMMHRHEVGIPETPSHLLIEGSWRDGQTATPRHPPVA